MRQVLPLLVLTSMVFLTACSTTPSSPHTAAAPQPPTRFSSDDDREFDIQSGGWERPPPYGARGNRALASR